MRARLTFIICLLPAVLFTVAPAISASGAEWSSGIERALGTAGTEHADVGTVTEPAARSERVDVIAAAFRTPSPPSPPATSTPSPPPPTPPAQPPPPRPLPTEHASFIRPAEGPITSTFGLRWGRAHTGTDIGAGIGAAVVAAQSGRVIYAGWEDGYGNTVLVDHGGGISTLYAHLFRIAVSTGQQVQQGEYLGAVGATGHATGPHLHYEVRVGGVPRDPTPWL